MATITLSNPVFYKNGEAGHSAVVGFESQVTRVVRYAFTAPSTGASSISFAFTGTEKGAGYDIGIRFHITTDANSHANAGASSIYTGDVVFSSNMESVSASARVILHPNTTYYLWLFPAESLWGWYYWVRTGTLTTTGGSSSQPTVDKTSVELGQPVTIYTNKAADFTHKLTWQFGGASGMIAENVVDSYTWTPSEALAQYIPNSPSGTAIISCTTYEGSVQVGNPLSVSVTLTVPDSLAPIVSGSYTDTSGAYSKVNAYVQNVSQLYVTVSATEKYGATITSKSVILDGSSYSGGVLSKSGSLELIVTATDSRGKTGTRTYTITVANYTQPQLTLSASRCLEDGTADDTGGFAKVTFKGSVTNVNGVNTASLSFTYGGTTESIAVSVGSFEVSKIITADSNSTMALSATLSDKLLSVTRSMTLSTGYATMDFLAGGKGIAFGKVATQEGFDCAMPLHMIGGNKIDGLPTPTGDTDAVPKSYADTSFAPNGYGLAGVAKDISGQDLNSITKGGWYFWGAATNAPFGRTWGYMHVMLSDGYSVTQTVRFTNEDQGCVLERVYTGGTWGEWEWVNPPMSAGVEYRTTERFNGRVIYTRLVDCGNITNGMFVKVTTDGGGAVRHAGVSGYNAPLDASEDISVRFYFHDGIDCEVLCSSNFEGQPLTIQVWYYKW